MDNKVQLATIGIVCITVLELFALYQELDGQYFSIVIGAIGLMVAGVIGYGVGKSSSITQDISTS